MTVKPMLDDLELQLVQQIEADEHQVRAQHAVPALEGDFLQPLGRRAERITLNGILTEDDDEAAGEKLKKLREKRKGHSAAGVTGRNGKHFGEDVAIQVPHGGKRARASAG